MRTSFIFDAKAPVVISDCSEHRFEAHSFRGPMVVLMSSKGPHLSVKNRASDLTLPSKHTHTHILVPGMCVSDTVQDVCSAAGPAER